MTNKFKNISITEIYNRIGLNIVNYEDGYLAIDDDDILKEYEEVIDSMGENKNTIPNFRKIQNFFKEHERYIDKGIIILAALERYFLIVKQSRQAYEKNKVEYDKRIEACKSLLDGEDISIYRHSIEAKTGLINRIVETSSVELCAYKIPNNILEMRNNTLGKQPSKNTSHKQKSLDEMREKRYIRRKKHYDNLKSENSKRLDNLEKEAGLKYILQFIELKDLSDVIVDNEYLGDVMAHEIMRMALHSELSLSGEEITQTLLNNTILDKYLKIENNKKLKYIEAIIRKYPEHINVDQMLLIAAFRASKFVAEEGISKKDMATVKKLLEFIHEHINTSEKTLGKFEKNGKIEVEEFGIKDIEDTLRRLSIKGEYLSDKKILEKRNALMNGEIFLSDINRSVGKIMGIDSEELDFLVKNFPENFLYFIDNFGCDDNQIRGVLKGTKTINTEILYKLLERGIIIQEEVPELCKERKLKPLHLVELASVDILERMVLIKSISEIQRYEDLDESEKKLLLQYFTDEKIKESLEVEENVGEFLDLYLSLLPEDEKERKSKIEELNAIAEHSSANIIIEMYKRETGIDINGKVDENTIIEFYEKNKIDISIIKKMYKDRIISQETYTLIVDDKYTGEDVVELLENGTIDLKTAISMYDGTKRRDIFSKYNYGAYSTANPALFAYGTGNMSVEQIDELYRHGIVKEKDIANAIKLQVYSNSRITELYVNLLISEDIIDELDFIPTKEKSFMKKALEMKNIAKNIDKSLGVYFDDQGQIEFEERVFLPLEKLKNEPTTIPEFHGRSNKKLRRIIPPFLREGKIMSYGFLKPKRDKVEYNEKSPFNDYEFYVFPDEQGKATPSSIVIAERYYKDRSSGEENLATDNATYIFELKDLTRISKKSKAEVLKEMQQASDTRMDKFPHSRFWAKNFDKRMHQLLDISLYEDKKEEIEELTKMIDGVREKDGTYTDMYGIYI